MFEATSRRAWADRLSAAVDAVMVERDDAALALA